MWTEALLFLVVLVLWKLFQTKPGFPPGPWGLPVVGYMPFLTARPYEKCFELSKKYGDIIGLTIGSFNCVVLNGEEIIREALKEMSFAGRPHFPFLDIRSGGKKKGVLFGEGSEWHEQRRFILRNLRDFGFGKRSMEEFIVDEVTELVTIFRSQHLNKPIELSQSFNVAVVNSLWAMVSGQRMSHDDPRILMIVDKLTLSFRNNHITGAQLFMPWLARYFPSLVNRHIGIESNKKMAPYMKDVITEHRRTYKEDHLRDLVDVYIKEMSACKNPKSSFYGEEAELTLLNVLLDLFVAGTETTSTTLRWAILYLLRNPEVQTKVQEELDREIGQSRLPSVQDRNRMPYTDATLMEVQRISTVLPLSVFHSTIEDTVFRGFHIPKDTVVLPNLYSVMHDPKHWQDPEKFRPERFLSEDGTARKDPYLIPFSVGKRVCLGETLAKESLFLFFTALLQNFTFQMVPGKTAPHPHDAYVGIVTLPKPFEVIIKDREAH